ncbi:MAG: hypothetical protein LBT32_00880 [Peptococcaceae bacterium]|jgi:beta-lactamase superfamily II metal-dependent hydrolase|nr:hypothetical protein [Peptococcaceae bacterium]
MKSYQKSRFLILLLIALLSLAGCGQLASQVTTAPMADGESAASDSVEIVFDENINPHQNTASGQGLLTVSYIDVGQADSILIQGPTGQAVLIDGGNAGDGTAILGYIKANRVGGYPLVE